MKQELNIESLRRAREFYMRSPDGQYDEIATEAIDRMIKLYEDYEMWTSIRMKVVDL